MIDVLTSARIRTALVVVILALAIGPAAEPAAAAAISVAVRDHDGDLIIKASAVLKADLATAWQVLTDYGRYVLFVPGLQASRVVRRVGARVTVEQLVEMPLWLFHASREITYTITEFPPTRLLSRSSGGCACTLESSYALAATQSGVRIEYVGRIVTASPLQSYIGRTAAIPFVTRSFEALANEIEGISMHRHQSAIHD